jgi:hypothetical protein
MVLGCQINSYPGLAWTCLHLLLPAFLLAHQGPVTFLLIVQAFAKKKREKRGGKKEIAEILTS